jgi:8-oxo-dGTP diphosphatase
MMIETFYRTSVKALIKNSEGKILLSKEENGMWELLGGGLDHGETPQTGLVREVQEETGLKVHSIASQPSYYVTFPVVERSYYAANVIFEAKIDSLDFTPSDECIALEYFSSEEILERDDIYQNVKMVAKLMLEN